jgi:hypothetical protein
MKNIDIANQITSDERYEVAKIHGLSKSYIDQILDPNNKRTNEAVLKTCVLIVTERKKMIEKLAIKREKELARLMESMKGKAVLHQVA